MHCSKIGIITFSLTMTAAAAQGQTANHRTLTLDGARAVAAAAVTEARRLNAPGGAIAVVDDGGAVLFVERLDNTFPAAANIAVDKARTAALFRRPSKVLEDAILSGRTTLLAVADAPLQGGEPIMEDGVVVGAVGVSGAASAAQDEEIAAAAAAHFSGHVTNGMAGDPAVSYLETARVMDAFERGAPLLETPEYKIHASRREAPGQAEIHRRDTDILYVLRGTATFVTGERCRTAAPWPRMRFAAHPSPAARPSASSRATSWSSPTARHIGSARFTAPSFIMSSR
jgi:glc operon protein GlcG